MAAREPHAPMTTLYAAVHRLLVDHPTISDFHWSPPQTPASSLFFLSLSLLSYLSLTTLLPHLPPPSPPLSLLLRPVSAVHNLFLLLLSLTMAVGSSLSTLSQMPNPSWPICFPLNTPPKGPTFFWAYVFYLSKFVEFIDTLLIILGGEKSIRRLSFLHVYHHTIVVVMCYLWLSTSQSLMPVALVTNACVHTLMYAYYLLCAVGRRPRWKRVVTDCQIVQFVFSFVVSVLMIWYHFTGEGCEGIWGWCFNAAFNGSLLYLFMDFHSKNYDEGKKRKGGGEEKKVA